MASSKNGDNIRVSAVVESAIAMALALGVAVYCNSLIGIALGSCIAPLLLLRSSASVVTSIRWFQAGLPKPLTIDNPFLLAPRYAWVLAWSLTVRVAATLRHPIKGIQSVPENWKRVVLCTGLFSPVELIPEMEPVKATLRRVTHDEVEAELGFLIFILAVSGAVIAAAHFSRRIFTAGWFNVVSWGVEAIFLILVLIFSLGFACYLAAFSYRLGLKSTALLWLPLLYVVNATFDESLSLQAKLREICISALWRLIRLIAWLTICLFGLKVIVLPQIIGWWNSQQWTSVLNIYVMPNLIHPWHVAAFSNAIIALVGYYAFLERAPRLLNEGAWSEQTVKRMLAIFTFVRTCISIYTIVVAIYLTVVAATAMHWPEWSWKPFPWQK